MLLSKGKSVSKVQRIWRRIGLFVCGAVVAPLLIAPSSAAIVLDRVDPFNTSLAHALDVANPEIFTIDPSISGILASIELAFPPNEASQLMTVSYSNNGSVFFGAANEMVPGSSDRVTFTPSATVYITAGNPFYVKLAVVDSSLGGAFYGGAPEPFTQVVSGPSRNMGYREYVDTDVRAVPEPSSQALLIGALFGLGWLQWRRSAGVRRTLRNAIEL